MPLYRLNCARMLFLFAALSVLLPGFIHSALAAKPVAPPAVSKEVRLTILHTNDTHGHLLPYSYPDTFDASNPISLLKTRRNIGGAARRATLVNAIRREKDHATLLIDAGDVCDGTPFSTEYHGDADIRTMNAVGYDLACPGNHEYNNTLLQVQRLIEEAKFPLLSANSIVKATGKSLYQPYIIREINGVKIAFFGLLTYDARTYPAARTELEMTEPIPAALKLVPELRKQADLVVAVTHIGVDEDIKMAASVPGIDLIVGGHSHTLLPEPLLIPHPSETMPNSVHGTIIVQDFQWAGTLGRLDLTLRENNDKTWHIAKYKGKLLPVTSATPEDAATRTLIDEFWNPIKTKYGAIIGEAKGDFAHKGPDYAEYNLVADAVREQLGLEFDIENMGGVRAPLAKGAITYGDMVSMDPFGNTIVTFRATGRQLKDLLAKNRPAVSGIRYKYANGQLTEATLGGKTIEDERVYSGATNNYYARFILTDIANKTETTTPRLETVLAYVRAHKSIQPLYDDRRVLIGVSDYD